MSKRRHISKGEPCRKANHTSNGRNGSDQLILGYYDLQWQADEELREQELREATGNRWIQRIFDSKIAKRGGVVRRKLSTIDNCASRAQLLDEVKHRRFHVVEIADQWLIICNKGELHLIS